MGIRPALTQHARTTLKGHGKGTLSHFGGSEGNELRPQQNETEKLLNEALSGENEKSMKERRGKGTFFIFMGLIGFAKIHFQLMCLVAFSQARYEQGTYFNQFFLLSLKLYIIIELYHSKGSVETGI